MLDFLRQLFKKYSQKIVQRNVLVKILLIASFITPFLMLYLLYPESYERTFKGRAYYIFFLWLILLEFALEWRNIDVKISEFRSARFLGFSIALFLPAIYILVANFSGLNQMIVELSPKYHGMDAWAKLMPLAIEYLILTSLFSMMITLAYGIKGLKDFLPPIALLGTVGSLFFIDNLYPYGEFTPFQMLVPSTATLATSLLRSLGYQTEWRGQTYKTPILRVWNQSGETIIGIAWPCSGIESLVIYSAIAPLSLKNTDIPRRWKILYFIIGAIITYLLNILRIVTIFIIAVNHGENSPEVWQFHNYYGPLYSILWISAYQLIIIGIHSLWKKSKKGA